MQRTTATDLPPIGPFRLEAELGAGGMGTVYRARLDGPFERLEPGRRVAVKVVHPHLVSEECFLERFRREAEIGAAVRHPNVVRTLGAAQIDDRYVLVMEYAEGKTLRALLEEHGRLPEALCVVLGREIAAGLAAIHEAGVIHRDLKPENVVVAPDQRSVKLMDLGLARVADEAFRLSVRGAFVGSVRYAAPEQFRGGGADVDHRVDLHGLGLVLYELSSGVHPYEADDMPELIRRVLNEKPRRLGERVPQLTPFFEEVVHTLLAKDREERFPTARALAAILGRGEASPWWRQRAQEIRASTHRPPRRVRLPRETPLFGREAELEALRSLYARVEAGEGQVVLLEGEAGIGKTRLLDEFVQRIHAEGEPPHCLTGAYPRAGAATGAGAFSTAYREHLGSGGARALLEDVPRLADAFEALLAGTAPPEGVPALDQASLATCFVRVTRALAREKPVVVLIEDLQLAPTEGRRLFTALARAVPDHRVLLVGTTQPDVPDGWLADLTAMDAVTHLELPRLGAQDVFRLLHEAFRSERIASTLTEKVHRRSDGNPFFVFEIVRGLLDSGLVNRDDDSTWTLTTALDRIEIPTSVREIVGERTEDLAPDERELLDVAACWGFEFDPRLVADALGLPPLEALRTYARIESRHRLVRARGPHFVFDAHQIQEALHAALLPEVRARYHTALAESLEARTGVADGEKAPAPEGAVVVDLCEHFLRSERPERALGYLDAALAHLESGYLHAEAPILAERALAVQGLLAGRARVRTLLRLASRLDLLGLREKQLGACTEAEAVARETGDAALEARACRACGVAHLRISDHEAARTWLERALAIAEAGGVKAEVAAATGDLGMLARAQGQVSRAREHHERHLALARELGDARQEARATLDLGNVFQTQGRLDEARQRYESLVTLARSLGDERIAAAALGNLGNVYYLQGLLPEARDHFGRAMSAAQELGDRGGEARVLGNLGAVFQAEGRFAEALALLRRARTLSREVGDLRGESNVLTNLAEVQLAQGDHAAALKHCGENLDLSRRIRYRQGEALALVGLARGAQQLGDAAVARSRFEWALATARAAGLGHVEAHALAGLGDLLVDAGAPEEGAARHREALALRRGMGDRRGIAASLVALAALHHELGEEEAAARAASEAVEMAALAGEPGLAVRAAACAAWLGVGASGDAARLLEDCGRRTPWSARLEAGVRLWRATGRQDHLDAARVLLEDAVGRAPEELRASMLENVPLHRLVAAG